MLILQHFSQQAVFRDNEIPYVFLYRGTVDIGGPEYSEKASYGRLRNFVSGLEEVADTSEGK